MAMQVPGQTTKSGDLTSLNDILTSGLATDGKLGLYLATFAPSRDSQLADFTAAEPTFNGYARVAADFEQEGLDQNGTARTMSANAQFRAIDAVTPENIGGAFLSEESVGPPVIARIKTFYPFSLPITVGQAGQSIGVKAVITAPDLSGYAMIEG